MLVLKIYLYIDQFSEILKKNNSKKIINILNLLEGILIKKLSFSKLDLELKYKKLKEEKEILYTSNDNKYRRKLDELYVSKL